MTTDLEVTTRQNLAALWLPWCVERRRPDRPIRIEREPERRKDARQLRVADLSDEAVRAALSDYPRDDGRDVLSAIRDMAADFASVPVGIVIDEAQAFLMDEGPMIFEGSHRTCAVWESGVKDFEIRATVHPLSPPWEMYDCAALRQETA